MEKTVKELAGDFMKITKELAMKSLTSEEQTALENAITLLQNIITMNTAETGNTETQTEQVTEAQTEKPNETELTDEEKKKVEEAQAILARKGKVKKDDEGNASEDAEKRVEDVQDETSLENIDDVAKKLLNMIDKKNQAQKSQVVNNVVNDKVAKALESLTKVITDIDERVKQSETTVEGILTGLGIVQKTQNRNSDKEEILNKLDQVQKALEKPVNEKRTVRKNIEGILSMLPSRQK